VSKVCSDFFEPRKVRR